MVQTGYSSGATIITKVNWSFDPIGSLQLITRGISPSVYVVHPYSVSGYDSPHASSTVADHEGSVTIINDKIIKTATRLIFEIIVCPTFYQLNVKVRDMRTGLF